MDLSNNTFGIEGAPRGIGQEFLSLIFEPRIFLNGYLSVGEKIILFFDFPNKTSPVFSDSVTSRDVFQCI